MGLLMVSAIPAQAYLTVSHVPLPKTRPAEAPQPPSQDAAKPEAASPVVESKPAEPPPPSPCRAALTEDVAIAPSIPDIKGPGACGGTDLVRLEAVVLPDKTRIPLKPGGTMRCTMAAAVADWVRSDMAPLASGLNTKLVELDNFDSFDCRGRNRVVGAKLSEHGRANALDVRGLKLANGQSIGFTDRATPRALREQVLHSVCTRFTTVLGPGSDGYHEDHIHLDLAERRGNYRICQWDVWDPLPPVAPLMPAVRPAEAPPRESEEAVPADEKPAATQPEAQAAPAADAGKVDDAAPEEAKPKPEVKAKPKAKKPRRRRVSVPFPLNLLR